MSNGFVDLRQNNHSAKGDDSFWPSFTDIMMVIVMIFLLASVILILRNWELVKELRATMEAERKAAEQARFTTAANATLEEQLAQAQHQLSVLRMQLMRSDELNQEKDKQLNERQQTILTLESRLQKMTLAAENTNAQLKDTHARLAQLQTSFQQLQTQYNNQSSLLEQNRKKLDRLQVSFDQKSSEADKLKKDFSQTRHELLTLRGKYDVIRIKYEKLIKPARTPVGKHVVEVRYSKSGGIYRISFKEPGDRNFRSLSRKSLEARLAELKKQHPKKLYVKIVIPDNSGLSYKEAWSFTKHMLDNYDYYESQY